MTACLMMAKKTYTTFPQLVNACVKLPFIKHIAPVPEASRQLLESFYTQLMVLQEIPCKISSIQPLPPNQIQQY